MIEPALIYDIAWIVGVVLLAAVVYHVLALLVMGVLTFGNVNPKSEYENAILLLLVLIFVIPALNGISIVWPQIQKHCPNAAERISRFVNECIDDPVIKDD